MIVTSRPVVTISSFRDLPNVNTLKKRVKEGNKFKNVFLISKYLLQKPIFNIYRLIPPLLILYRIPYKQRGSSITVSHFGPRNVNHDSIMD